MPPPAAAAPGDIEQASLLAISTVGAIGVLVFGALAFGAFTLLRRTRRATSEVRRLNALLDVLDEGVAVCSGMQAVAVNTSLCRLIGVEPQDVAKVNRVLVEAGIAVSELRTAERALEDVFFDLTTKEGDHG